MVAAVGVAVVGAAACCYSSHYIAGIELYSACLEEPSPMPASVVSICTVREHFHVLLRCGRICSPIAVFEDSGTATDTPQSPPRWQEGCHDHAPIQRNLLEEDGVETVAKELHLTLQLVREELFFGDACVRVVLRGTNVVRRHEEVRLAGLASLGELDLRRG